MLIGSDVAIFSHSTTIEGALVHFIDVTSQQEPALAALRHQLDAEKARADSTMADQ
jgi:hypothetical protein